ncbi:hypothetical protein SDC9_119729 [bioreactor metagenome]|uniref:Uncharacterized protein n=1 Tax=bioreactor metagenome TaxID=1076179 RepID=A0A645C8W3_9ZZZZ
MGDEENGLPLRRQIAHNPHQLVDLLRRQDGGRLVEYQDLVVPVEHFQNLGALLHTHGDVPHIGVRVHHQSVFFRQGHHLFPGLCLLQEAVPARLHAHDNVVQHGEALHQLKMLVDHTDAQGVCVVWVLDGNLFPVHADGPLFRPVQAEQDAHQRGLSRAVFPQQRVDLSLF